MFLFHSCNHALTPHFHQFTVLDAEPTPSVSNPLPNIYESTAPVNHQPY